MYIPRPIIYFGGGGELPGIAAAALERVDAIGGKPAAVAVLVFGGLAAVALATSVRTVRAAAISGLLLAAGLVALLVFFAYVRGA